MFKFSFAKLRQWRSGWTLKFYLRIYLAMLASLIVAGIILYFFVQTLQNTAHFQKSMEEMSDVASDILEPFGKNEKKEMNAIMLWSWIMEADVSVYRTDGTLSNSSKSTTAKQIPNDVRAGFFTGRPDTFAIKLRDQRWVIIERGKKLYIPSFNQTLGAILLVIAVALGSYPIVRRLTKRLERLQNSVNALGSGQLSTRVLVEGNDEVAQLAMSFNQSAERIENLVNTQKSLLANASHELRSPLTRIRMAIELLIAETSAPLRAELQRNINELDQLIDEILLSSRLDAQLDLPTDHVLTLAQESIDMLGLLAEECAKVNAELNLIPNELDATNAPTSFEIMGDAKLLRRLFRNLLENAQRYGNNTEIEVNVLNAAGALQIDVCDRGNGVPPEQRERIFEAFYRLPGASESNGGVGLGLSLVKRIAEKHQGSVQCLPREGGGSCFRVQFKVAQEFQTTV